MKLKTAGNTSLFTWADLKLGVVRQLLPKVASFVYFHRTRDISSYWASLRS